MLCQLGRTPGLFRALTFESHHVSRPAQACVAANTKIETNQAFDGVIERFSWSVAQFNPCGQPRDGPFEETSGGGRTKRVRAPGQGAGKRWRHSGAARWAEPGIWR